MRLQYVSAFFFPLIYLSTLPTGIPALSPPLDQRTEHKAASEPSYKPPIHFYPVVLRDWEIPAGK